MTFIFENLILIQSRGFSFVLGGEFYFFSFLVLLYLYGFELHSKLRLNLVKLDKLLYSSHIVSQACKIQ